MRRNCELTMRVLRNARQAVITIVEVRCASALGVIHPKYNMLLQCGDTASRPRFWGVLRVYEQRRPSER